MPLTKQEEKEAITLLKRSILLRECTEEELAVKTLDFSPLIAI
jgi:hypothetical protein